MLSSLKLEGLRAGIIEGVADRVETGI